MFYSVLSLCRSISLSHNSLIGATILPQSFQIWLYRRKSVQRCCILISALLFQGAYSKPAPNNPFPSHSRAVTSQIAKHELIHNFSKCSGLTTTCNPAAKAARISSTYPIRVGITTFPFQTYKGRLNLPNFGLFFYLGLMGVVADVCFQQLRFMSLCRA